MTQEDQKSKEEKRLDRKQAISERAYDLFTCFKISLVVFAAIIVIGIICAAVAGVKNDTFGIRIIIDWTFSVGVWIGTAGMVISVFAFLKPKLMGDLTHQKQWRTHFYKMNLIGVIFATSAYVFIYEILLDYARVLIYYR